MHANHILRAIDVFSDATKWVRDQEAERPKDLGPFEWFQSLAFRWWKHIGIFEGTSWFMNDRSWSSNFKRPLGVEGIPFSRIFVVVVQHIILIKTRNSVQIFSHYEKTDFYFDHYRGPVRRDSFLFSHRDRTSCVLFSRTAIEQESKKSMSLTNPQSRPVERNVFISKRHQPANQAKPSQVSSNCESMWSHSSYGHARPHTMRNCYKCLWIWEEKINVCCTRSNYHQQDAHCVYIV